MKPLTLTELPEIATTTDIAQSSRPPKTHWPKPLPAARVALHQISHRVRYLKADIFVYLAAAQEHSKVNA